MKELFGLVFIVLLINGIVAISLSIPSVSHWTQTVVAVVAAMIVGMFIGLKAER